MGRFGAACLALIPIYGRHVKRRAQVDRVRARVETWLSAPQQNTLPAFGGGPQQLDGSPEGGAVDPPTSGPTLPIGSAVQCRRRVAFSDPNLDATLGPRWRFQ